METNWYAKPGSGGQGLVLDEQTGRTVAVAYDVKDAPVLAASPALLDALRCALNALEGRYPWPVADGKYSQKEARKVAADVARAAIAKARGEG